MIGHRDSVCAAAFCFPLSGQLLFRNDPVDLCSALSICFAAQIVQCVVLSILECMLCKIVLSRFDSTTWLAMLPPALLALCASKLRTSRRGIQEHMMVRPGEDLFCTQRANIYHSASHCNKWTPKFGPELLRKTACNLWLAALRSRGRCYMSSVGSVCLLSPLEPQTACEVR